MALVPFKLKLLNYEEKQLFVGGWYQLVLRGSQPMRDVPNHNIVNDEDSLYKFFRKQWFIKIYLLTAIAKSVEFGVVIRCCYTKAKFTNMSAAALNAIPIPGMLVQFPDFFYAMYKNNNLKETIIQWI